MALDDTSAIDIVLDATAHAKCTLLIMDGGTHADEEIRFAKLTKKLGSYVAYISGSQFAVDHPGVAADEVLIGILCSQPPSERMKQITHARPHGKPDVLIRVHCVHHVMGAPLPWFISPIGKPPG